MASTRAMTAATIATARQATGEEAAELTAQVARIGQWLESAMLGYSDRDCERMSDYAPVFRRMRRATTQLRDVA